MYACLSLSLDTHTLYIISYITNGLYFLCRALRGLLFEMTDNAKLTLDAGVQVMVPTPVLLFEMTDYGKLTLAYEEIQGCAAGYPGPFIRGQVPLGLPLPNIRGRVPLGKLGGTLGELWRNLGGTLGEPWGNLG